MPDPLEQFWVTTRQGARNLAGVRFQTAVAAYLLAGCGTQQAVLVEVVHEGHQDIDGRRPDGRHLLVQVKERAGGNTTLPLAPVAAAIAEAGDALRADPDASLAIVTDARPGAGLAETGWDRPLSDIVDRHEIDPAIRELLGRCHLVCLDWGTIDAVTRTLLERTHALPGAAAELLRTRMIDDLLRAGADQRDTDARWPIARRRSDVDVLATRIRELVDLDALDAPVRDGLVEFVDFTTPLQTSVETFLAGIDVLPGHIAANLDLLRPNELASLFEALAGGRYVVIAGPSGSGKSALLWRAAYKLGPGMRLVRVRRVSDGDVAAIARWVRTLAPSETTPVLVCIDDIGRPHTARWPALAEQLLEQPGVRLLAAAREEDFEPAFVTAGGVPVRPRLTPELGLEIAAQLEAREVPLHATPEAAVADADGLLMEFVAILTTGRRLEAVVTEQVHARFVGSRETERDALRFVSAAHIAGLALDPNVLNRLCARAPDLPQALATLSDELLIREARDGTWRGLHELRSSAVNRAIHEVPPPESETLQQLLAALDGGDAIHLLRRTADRLVTIAPLLDAIATRIAGADAAETAAWLQSALAIDALEHLRRCVETAEREFRPEHLDLVRFAWLRRFARLPDDILPANIPIGRYANALPEPDTHHAERLATAHDADRITTLAAAAPPADCAELLETWACAGATSLSGAQARTIIAAHDAAPLEPFSRIVAALAALCPDAARVLGPRNRRLDRIAQEHTALLRWTAETDARDPTGLEVVLEVFVASGALDVDYRHALVRIALDLCPEAVRINIDPRGPEGTSTHADVWGGARFHRLTATNPHLEGRSPRLMSDSLERLGAADSWAQRLTAQHELAQQLSALLESALERLLNRHDTAGRRREWRTLVDGAVQLAEALPKPPVPRVGEEATRDHVGDTLTRIAHYLRALGRDLERPGTYGGHARGLRRVFSELWLPFRDLGRAGESALGRQVEALRSPVRRLADFLIARTLTTPGRRDRAITAPDAADAFIAQARALALDAERERLGAILPADGITLSRLPRDGEGEQLAGDLGSSAARRTPSSRLPTRPRQNSSRTRPCFSVA